jgi:hypothetical protein
MADPVEQQPVDEAAELEGLGRAGDRGVRRRHARIVANSTLEQELADVYAKEPWIPPGTLGVEAQGQ